MPSHLDVALPPLISAVLGFLGAYAGTLVADRRKAGQERQATLEALLAEMTMIEDINKRRGVIQTFENILAGLECGQDATLPYFPINDDGLSIIPVYEALVEKIGVLAPADARDITLFYAYVRSVRASMESWKPPASDGWSISIKKAAVRSELELIRLAVASFSRVDSRALRARRGWPV